jgi:hypothetical protein
MSVEEMLDDLRGQLKEKTDCHQKPPAFIK